MAKLKGSTKQYVFVEWRDQNSQYHGANYVKAELPQLLEKLRKQGVSRAFVDEVEQGLSP